MSWPAPPLEIVCDVIARLRSCDISECNGPAQYLAVQRLMDTGKHVDELTVGEARRIIRAARREYETLLTTHPSSQAGC